MDRLQDWLSTCVLALCILVTASYAKTDLNKGTCKDGVCTGFSQGVADETIKFRPYSPDPDLTICERVYGPPALNYIAKVLSKQRKFGPEITPQDILDLLETVRERKSET